MRSLILVLFILASHTLVWGQLKTPLSNAVLLNDLQGNGQDILNLGTVSLGSGPQGTRRIHLVPNGSPTTPADGIGFGNDVTLYRSSNGTLTLNGNLVINGTLNTNSGDEANLQSLKQVPPLLNNFIVGTGTGWVGKNPAQTRAALGLTPLATANLVTSAYIEDGTIVNADLAPGVALANLTGGTGTLNLSGYSITYPENPVFNGVVSVANDIVFEGSVVDNFETTLTVQNPTADRTITLPDASGTVALVGDLVSGYQPLDSDLTAIAALPTTSYGRNLLTLSDAAALRSNAGLVIGTNVQAWDSDLDAIAALSTTNYGRGLLTLSDAAALRSNAGLVIGTNVQAWDSDLDVWATKTPPTGDVVGATDTQTLTNKTIINPTINGATLNNGTITGVSINGGSVVNSDIVYPKIVLDPKSSSFTAEFYKYYATTGTVTVTDPASPTAGHYYFVLVQSGTATIGGTVFGASRIPIYRYYNGSSWVTLPISVNWSELTNIPANINTWATKTPPSGDVVGTTDTQTLTNKTITNPTINGATVNSSTLQNPTINSATLNNGTINAVGVNNSSVINPDIFYPKIVLDPKSSSFTAEFYKYYATTGTVTVTDPASPTAGHYYVVLVQSGTATIGGTPYSPSSVPIYRYYNGSSWVTLPIPSGGAADWASITNIPANITTWATKTPPSGNAVGTTDTQTLTNKTLTAPVINSPKIQFDPKSSNFTAETFGHYAASGNLTVSDPPSPVTGHYYVVLVQAGTTTIGGTPYSPSSVPIYRYYNGSSWSTLPIPSGGAADWASITNIPANITTWATKTPPTGDVVGITDTQTLTNKTLTAPVINSPKIQFDPKSANFTAEIFGHYAASGNLTVSDPASPTAGHYYVVLVQSGNATIGGTPYSPSSVPICRYYNGSSWLTLPSANILPGSIGTTELANNAVTQPKIADGAVTQTKLDSSLLSYLLSRANHTGSQLASTISDFATAALNAVTWNTLTGKPSTFPPSSHTHPVSELTQSGAATGNVLRWNGSAWAPAAPSTNLQVVVLKDIKPQNTEGQLLTTDAWNTRHINTEEADTANICTLSNNQFTLPAGTYQISATITAGRDSTAKSAFRLRNVSDSTDVLFANSVSHNLTGTAHVMTSLAGVFTINSSKTFEIQQYPKLVLPSYNQYRGGYPAEVPGVSECYLTAIIIRLQ
jgi:hypothetical protein